MTMTTIKTAFFLFFILACLSPINVFSAKSVKEDRKIWGQFEVKYSLNKQISFDLSQEFRYYKNREILEQRLTDFGVNYKFTDWFRTGVFYRHKAYPDVTSRKKDKYADEAYINFTFKYDIYGFELSDRARLHARFKVKEDDSYFLRNKLSAEYKELLTWARPFAAAEIYHRIAAGSNNVINKGRYSLGVNFIPIRNNEISVYFLRENEYNQKKIVNSNVIGLSYQLKL